MDGRTGDSALFNEPGPRISAAEYAEFRAGYAGVLAGCAAVVLSGQPAAGPAARQLRGADRDGGCRRGAGACWTRTGTRCAWARPPGPPSSSRTSPSWRCSPGGRCPGRPARTGRPWRRPRRELRAAGAGAVVVSLGAEGLLAVTGDGSWEAVPPAVVAGNATGAGDAVAAGLAHGLALGRPWDERLRHAVALGTASAMAPVAGEFSPADYASLLDATVVTRGAAGRGRGRLMPAHRDGGDRRAGPGGRPRRRRVQRDRHRARRGHRGRGAGRRRAGGAADQRELRGLPRRARADRPGLPVDRGLGRRAGRGAPGPRHP